jgi:hypothetical protein
MHSTITMTSLATYFAPTIVQAGGVYATIAFQSLASALELASREQASRSLSGDDAVSGDVTNVTGGHIMSYQTVVTF